MKTTDIEGIIDDVKAARKKKDWPLYLALCREGRSVLSAKENFDDWYLFSANLAAQLADIDVNDGESDIEEAIAIFHKILEFLPSQEPSKRYGDTHRNLGFVYSERIEGCRQNNLVRSLEHDQKSLAFFTREAFPHDWALIKRSIAICLSKQEENGVKVNIQRAIDQCTEILKVFPKDDDPEEWQDTMELIDYLKARL